MSLPDFDPQGSLFSTAGIGTSLFAKDDRYRLFATVIYPCLFNDNYFSPRRQLKFPTRHGGTKGSGALGGGA